MSITAELYDDKSNLKLWPIFQLLALGNGPLATTGCDHGAFVNTRGEKGQGIRVWARDEFVRGPLCV